MDIRQNGTEVTIRMNAAQFDILSQVNVDLLSGERDADIRAFSDALEEATYYMVKRPA